MAKFNAGDKSSHVVTPGTNLKSLSAEQQHHQKDESKMEMARKGNFGTKDQLHDAIGKLKEKFPAVHVTHRHNSTVR